MREEGSVVMSIVSDYQPRKVHRFRSFLVDDLRLLAREMKVGILCVPRTG